MKHRLFTLYEQRSNGRWQRASGIATTKEAAHSLGVWRDMIRLAGGRLAVRPLRGKGAVRTGTIPMLGWLI